MKKSILAAITCVAVLAMTGCTKEGVKGDTGATGATGATGQPGPEAKTFEYTLTYNIGDKYQTYSGITGFESGDVIVTYVLYDVVAGSDTWVQLPFDYAGTHFYPEFSEVTGQIFMHSLKSGTTSQSPWVSSGGIRSFKSVLIKSTGMIQNPDVDLSNYEEVAKTFGLE